jgi:8-oxo-dGTP diphosphatase
VSNDRENRSVAGISLRDGRYFIARRLAGGDLGGKWEFPGGKVEGGEEPEEALRREYDEEFGVRIAVGPKICEVGFRHGEKDFRLDAYFVDLEDGLGKIELREHSEIRWASLGDLLGFDLAESDRKILPFLA